MRYPRPKDSHGQSKRAFHCGRGRYNKGHTTGRPWCVLNVPVYTVIFFMTDVLCFQSGTKELIQIKYPHLLEDLDIGDSIFINDGIVKLVIQSKDQTSLLCRVEAGGQIADRKGCNIPKSHLSVDILTEKDKVPKPRLLLRRKRDILS